MSNWEWEQICSAATGFQGGTSIEVLWKGLGELGFKVPALNFGGTTGYEHFGQFRDERRPQVALAVAGRADAPFDEVLAAIKLRKAH
jgi:hypothetical protein